jgi:hypothetical protein
MDAESSAQPDISDLRVVVGWANDDETRNIEVQIRHPDIPCTGTDDDLLGESGVECTSAPWELVVDGTPLETLPVTCTSAHDGMFGPVPKRCEGGWASAQLPDSASEDVEIVATTATDEAGLTIHGARGRHTFVEEAPFRSIFEPGIVRVDGLELLDDGGFVVALYTSADGSAHYRDAARLHEGDSSRLELSPSGIDVSGVYDVRILAGAAIDGATVALPIDGSLTVDL